ncbi:hypothetical protein [Serinicoccus marinus]|uniref:hypothetical protein n=1 Tax=Serinicoccus marinus TaxID=247333 RepID=UPI00248F8619|nr:hypothetical protein [Serinicoccus marinus]
MVLTSDVVVTMGLTEEEKVQMPTHGLQQIDWDDLTSLEGRTDLDAAYERIAAKVGELVDALLERDVAAARSTPRWSARSSRSSTTCTRETADGRRRPLSA